MQVCAPVLCSNISFRIKRDSQIRAIYLFLDNKVVLQEFITLRFRKNLVAPDINTSQRCQMWRGGEFEKIVFHAPIFSSYLVLT